MGWCIGVHHGRVNAIATNHATQGDDAIGDPFGKGDHVGHHAEQIGCKRGAHATKTGDDFIEHQQDAVLVANLAQALQIALGWDVPTGAASHGLDKDGRHIARVVQGQDALLQIQQRVFCPHRQLVLHISVVHGVVDKAHVIDARQHGRAKHFAVARDAANAHAAQTHPVVAALATDEHLAVALTTGAVVGQRQFHSGVCCFRTGTAKQHFVQIARGEFGDALRGFKRAVGAKLKRGGVVQAAQLLVNGFVDRLDVVARHHAPQAGNTVQHLLALLGGEVHAIGTHHDARRLVELTIRGEGQPKMVHRNGGWVHENAPWVMSFSLAVCSFDSVKA